MITTVVVKLSSIARLLSRYSREWRNFDSFQRCHLTTAATKLTTASGKAVRTVSPEAQDSNEGNGVESIRGDPDRGVSTSFYMATGYYTESADELSLMKNDVMAGYENVFDQKSMLDLLRAVFVFKLCSYDTLVRHSAKLMNVGQKILGKSIFKRIMKSTFYGQFVAGGTEHELQQTVDQLLSSGVRPILFVPIEEDGDEIADATRYDENLETVERCLHLAKKVYPDWPIAQMKLTALVPGKLVSLLSEKVPDPQKDQALIHAVQRCLAGKNLKWEGDDTHLLLESLERMKHVGKQLFSVNTDLEKDKALIQAAWRYLTNEGLLDHENTCLMEEALARMTRLGQVAQKLNVRVLLDAEYTYLNPALRLISLAMMLQFNKDVPLFAYTYQNYLKDTHRQLREDVEFVESQGAGFAAKLVRGAYMNQERSLAQEKRYPDPVHADFQGTTDMYNRSMYYMMDKVRASPDKFYFMVASHNEETVIRAKQQMELRDFPNTSTSVLFGQVYGMAEHLSGKLGRTGYTVYKSIPYGPLEDTLPYLNRRATENSALFGSEGTKKERAILWNSLKGRLLRH